MLRQAGTERAFTGRYWDCHDDGVYRCAGCGAELFDSATKFESGSGWPSFTEPKLTEAVELRDDNAYGMRRTEVVCKRCGGHLGHVFDDGPRDDGGLRYCINSCSLDRSASAARRRPSERPRAAGAPPRARRARSSARRAARP